MGHRLAATGGPVRRAALAAAALLVLAPAGCGRDTPAPPDPGASAAGASAGFNDTDVMFLQMALTQIGEGEQILTLAEERATAPEVRAIMAELRGQWRDESGALQRWLLSWGRPLTADSAAGAHAGHGDLHSLRPADLAELRTATGAAFDRMAVALLLGHLHNCVETFRMQTAGGGYPPAKQLAERMTTTRQGQIQRLLALASQN